MIDFHAKRAAEQFLKDRMDGDLADGFDLPQPPHQEADIFQRITRCADVSFPQCVYKFGTFVLDPTARRLEKSGYKITLGDRAFDILHVLVSRPGSVVTKEELIAVVWRNVRVDEGSLRVRLVEIRKVLDAPGCEQSLIANIKGQGYCFVGKAMKFSAASSSRVYEIPDPSSENTAAISLRNADETSGDFRNVWQAEILNIDAGSENENGSSLEIELSTGIKLRIMGSLNEASVTRIISALAGTTWATVRLGQDGSQSYRPHR